MVDCTDFLRLLQTGQSKQGVKVNCDDCAAFVVSFANILGCKLNEGRMGVNIFKLKPHQRIGSNDVKEGEEFSFHTVGWTGESKEDDKVFDACLKLKADEDPQWFVPTNIPFGRLGQRFYRFRLAIREDKCEPVEADITRSIGFIADTPPLPAWLQRFLESLSAGDADLDWRLREYRLLPSDDSVFIQTFWSNLAQPKAAVRLDLFWTRRPPKDKLDDLLRRYQLTAIKPQEKAAFGDEVHAVPTNFAIVFRQGKVVVQMRNIGAVPARADDLATIVDRFLRRTAETEINR
jgi:hypothetical protein